MRGGLLVLNLLVFVIVGLLLWKFWIAELHDAEHQAVGSATQLQQSVGASLGKAEVAVRYATVQAEAQIAAHGLQSPALWAVLNNAKRNVPELQRMGLFDEDGNRLCSADDTDCRRYNIGDRDYFALLRQHPDLPPSLFGPVRARPNDELALLMAQAVRLPGKPFAGVIVAVIPLATLQSLVDAARVGPLGSAGLRTEKLEFLARAGVAQGDLASAPTSDVSATLRRQLALAPEGGTYRAVVAADKIERVVAYQHLPGLPVYAFVGLGIDDINSAWRNTAAWGVGLSGLLVVASLVIERLVRSSLSRQSQAQALYDAAPCGYHTLDPDGRYLSINATELGWLGCTREEVIGKLGPADFFTEEGRATMASRYPEFKRTDRLDQLELDLVSRQGIVRRVVVTATAVRDKNGTFALSNSVMHDITALHAVQRELATWSLEQQAMLDTELVGMLKVRAGLITWTNSQMDRIFRYDRDEWSRMPVAQLFDDDGDYRQTAAEIGALTEGGGHFRKELKFRRKDGTALWLDASTTKIDPSGAESFTIVKDITDRKAEEATRLRAMELEVQNVALQESGRLKDEFLSNLSHELRTPLNAVIGFSQLIDGSKALAGQPKYEKYIRQIADSGQHLLELVQTMLDFVKTASKKMRFEPVNLRVQATLEEVVAMLEPKALAAKVSVAALVEPELDAIVNDSLRLRQMLLNLTGNAVKFSKPGGTVTLYARAIDAQRWCVEVRDQGIGIAPENLPRLFAPFVQLSSGSTKAYGGTGLGLALVRTIAQAQGGDVSVQSELGNGSVFTLTLPRVLAVQDGSNLGDQSEALDRPLA